MKYTTEQRREIYLKCARRIQRRIGSLFMCNQIDSVTDHFCSDYGYEFPEFYFFKNKKAAKGSSWFGYKNGLSIDGAKIQRARIVILLFAAELCNDKDFQKSLK